MNTPTKPKTIWSDAHCNDFGASKTAQGKPELPQNTSSHLTPDAKRPWQNDAVTMGGESLMNVINRLNGHLEKVILERNSLRAHADKLAEALRAVLDDRDGADNMADAALADYDKSKGGV